jgi:uncharacterized membrane protein
MYSWQEMWTVINWFFLSFTILVLLAALLWSIAPVGHYMVDSWRERHSEGDVLARRLARGEISRYECTRRIRAVRRARHQMMGTGESSDPGSGPVAKSS